MRDYEKEKRQVAITSAIACLIMMLILYVLEAIK